MDPVPDLGFFFILPEIVKKLQLRIKNFSLHFKKTLFWYHNWGGESTDGGGESTDGGLKIL